MEFFYSTLINFAIVLFIVWHYGRKPATAFLQNRSVAFGDLVGRASLAAKEAFAYLSQSEERFKQKETEIENQWNEARSLIAKVQRNSEETIKKEEERIRREAELFSKSEWTRAVSELEHALMHQSVGLARDFFAQNVEDKDRDGLVKNYMEHVGNGTRK